MSALKPEICIQENDSNDAPPPKQKELLKKIENNLLICPECSSEIEILLINEETNMIEFKCIKNNHKKNLSIIQYLKEINNIKNQNNLNAFKDQCDIHKNNNYISYCFECNCHLCNECLKIGTHLIHKKSNIIEIQPIEKELKIISEIIKDKKINLEKLYEEKERKHKELNNELTNKKNIENNLLKDKIKLITIRNIVELEQNTKKYILDINDIKKKYENEIKELKAKYQLMNNKINNIYKLKNEKEEIEYNLKIEKLNILYKNKYEAFNFESKIEKEENIIKINENIFNLYNAFNNNYFNSININNLLVSYSKNEFNNEKMQKILGKDYEQIIRLINNKYKEGINILNKKDEFEELKIKFEEEKIKSEKLSNMNIELCRNKEKEEGENIKLKEKNNELNNKIDGLNHKIDELNKTNKEKCLIIDKYEKYFSKEMKELENYQIQNSNINFEDNPSNLKYHEELASDRINSGLLYNIEVYIGLQDNIGYLVYQELNYNLIVMRIYDKTIIKSLEGHKDRIKVIRYYHNKSNKINNEQYILSCDANKLIIIWDVGNDFNQKYSFQEKFECDLYDALILFNIFGKNYIITCSDNYKNKDEYTKLYELKENISFVKNIYNTDKIKTNYLIPWLYKNKYYIISCCKNEISINNIFEEETYAKLNKDHDERYYCGFIYNDNYLCVSDSNNNLISIWDLVNKTIYKTIRFNADFGYEMVQWNDKYTIIGCNKCLIIIDLEDGEVYKKIEGNNRTIFGLKKIKDENLGESLICSEENNIISIYKKKQEDDEEDDDDESEDENFRRRRSRRRARRKKEESSDEESEEEQKIKRKKKNSYSSSDDSDNSD